MLFARHKLIDAPTTVRSTTRISRIPTTRFPTTPKPTCQEDGQKYPVGHVISRNDDCEHCTCGYHGRNRDPDWMCMATDCFGYPHCEKIRHIAGQCCPVCDGNIFSITSCRYLLLTRGLQCGLSWKQKWPLCCLFFFDIWILITPLVSSHFSYIKLMKVVSEWETRHAH